jgi:hypothetical protein
VVVSPVPISGMLFDSDSITLGLGTRMLRSVA